jgi:two-component system sensor histidine kinase BaeS
VLRRLVDDFQQLALADAGHLHLQPQNLPLRETLDAMLAPLARTAGASWRTEGPADLRVVADEERLRQVVANLAENAARHGAAPEWTVVVRAASEAVAVFEFLDNGPGVAAGDVPFIFQRFYRAEKSRSRATGGAGLGLAIVHGLVEAMGGSIRYEPVERGGASFVVGLPRVR